MNSIRQVAFNEIILGDCLDVMRKFPDESIDLIIADPPYLTTNEAWDEKESFNEEQIIEFFRVLRHSGNLYIWCGIGEKSQSLIRWFPMIDKYFHFKDLITWKKSRGIGMRKGWLYTREEIMWFVKDNKRFVWNKENQYSTERRKRDKGKDTIQPSQNGKFCKSLYKRWTNVWTDISEQTDDVINFVGHYTPKPVKAIERIIQLHTKENDVVLDPFIGSGTTAIACINTNRNFIGIEISNEYYELAIKRVREAFDKV